MHRDDGATSSAGVGPWLYMGHTTPIYTWWTRGQQCQLLFALVLNTGNFHAPSLLGILGTQHMLDAPLSESLMPYIMLI